MMTQAQESPSGHSHRPVDLVHLSRQTFGDRDLEREVLDLFERQSLAMIQRLRHATTARTWAEAAHTLKGSARGIGAFAVAEAAEALEFAHVDHLSAEAWGELAQLESRVNDANAFIQHLRAA